MGQGFWRSLQLMRRESLSQPGGTNELSSSITTEFFCNERVLVHVHMQSRVSGQGSVSVVHLSSIQPAWCILVLVGRAYLSLGSLQNSLVAGTWLPLV